MLSVNAGNSVEQIREYFRKEKLTVSPVREKDCDVSRLFGVSAWPTNYLIGPDGKAAARMVGFDPAAFQTALEARRKGK